MADKVKYVDNMKPDFIGEYIINISTVYLSHCVLKYTSGVMII